MNLLSQKWRQLISTRPSDWSDQDVYSATAQLIAAQQNFDYTKVLNHHPWLNPAAHFKAEIDAPIAALGWVYQSLNDQRRFEIDRMLQERGQIEIEQIAVEPKSSHLDESPTNGSNDHRAFLRAPGFNASRPSSVCAACPHRQGLSSLRNSNSGPGMWNNPTARRRQMSSHCVATWALSWRRL